MRGKTALNQYQERLDKIRDYMVREGIDLVMFEDAEGKRDAGIRWLTGHPRDALLFLFFEPESTVHTAAVTEKHGSASALKSLLVPWDINLAKAYSTADVLIPYSDFDRIPIKAITGAAEKLKIPHGAKIEIPPLTPYPVFLDYISELTDFDIICRKRSAVSYTQNCRAVKDSEEIAIYRKAAKITNKIIDLVEKNVRSGKIKTEADAAMFIELESRKRGCDGTGFETIAAGQDRSFGIHAFPAWTGAPFAGQGLSILDFGLSLGGYTTDVTMTFVRDPFPQQQKMVNLVEKAVKLAVETLVNGYDTKLTAIVIDEIFTKQKKRMVHAAGHGIGLDPHELPFIKCRSEENWILSPGMVFALEPGLYDPIYGGCRLENDFLMTETGCEKLTDAKIVYL